MEYKDRLVNKQAESMGQDEGHIHHPLSSRGSQYSFSSPNASDLRMAIQVEIEKEKIREEIIISEIARRRVLESEVRRELMKWVPAMGGLGQPLSFRSSPLTELVSPTRVSHLGTNRGISLEEKVRMGMDEAKKETHDSVGFGMPPSHGSTSGLEIPEVKPVGEEGREGKKIILLRKLDENTSLSKWKLISPPRQVNGSDLPPSDSSNKKLKMEWSCSICRVNCNSQQVLNNHLQGRKHKAREKSRKNHCIGLLTEKNTTVDAAVVQDEKSTAGSVLPSGKNPGPDMSTIVDKSTSTGKTQKNDKPEKKVKYRYWCELCQVGTFCGKAMSVHKAGLKHANGERKVLGVVAANVSVTIPEVVNNAERLLGDDIITDGDKLVKTTACKNMSLLKANEDAELAGPTKPENREKILMAVTNEEPVTGEGEVM